MFFVREGIPYNLRAIKNKPIESIYVAWNLWSDKCLINCSYNPHRTTISTHINKIKWNFDLFSINYKKIILLGDFNVEVNDNYMKFFCGNYGLKNLIKPPACYKNPSNPTCIDLILAILPQSFQSTCVVEIGLSDFHMMTLTVRERVLCSFNQ